MCIYIYMHTSACYNEFKKYVDAVLRGCAYIYKEAANIIIVCVYMDGWTIRDESEVEETNP